MSAPSADWIFEDSSPPGKVIAVQPVIRDLHIAKKTLKKLNKAGKLSAWLSRQVHGKQKGAIPCILLSYDQVQSLIGSTVSGRKPASAHEGHAANPQICCSLPTGAQFIRTLTETLQLPDHLLIGHCEWDPHPALGRKPISGYGSGAIHTKRGDRLWRGQWMMEADAKVIAEALQERPEGKKYPGNPGVWERVVRYEPAKGPKSRAGKRRIEGRFLHEDGRRFITVGEIDAHYNFSYGGFGQECFTRKVKSLTVILPGCSKRWEITVWEEDGVKALAGGGRWDDVSKAWVKGYWLDPNEIWVEGDARWYSSVLLANRLRTTLSKIAALRRSGILTRYHEVPRGQKHDIYGKRKRKNLGTIKVHHESEVSPLLSLTATVPPAQSADTENGRPSSTQDDPYVAAKEAMRLTACSFSYLSKLCCEGGPVRFRKPAKNRLQIHLPDLARFLRERDSDDE